MSSLVVTRLMALSVTRDMTERTETPTLPNSRRQEGGIPCRNIPRTRSLRAISTGCLPASGEVSISLVDDRASSAEVEADLHIPQNNGSEMSVGRLQIFSISLSLGHAAIRSRASS